MPRSSAAHQKHDPTGHHEPENRCDTQPDETPANARDVVTTGFSPYRHQAFPNGPEHILNLNLSSLVRISGIANFESFGYSHF
jgi:hypothetical protein